MPMWDWAAIRDWFLRTARRYVDAAAAEDVAHEALVRAWQSRATCRQPDHPWPWLARILQNEAFRHIDKAAGSSSVPEVTDAVDQDRTDEVLARLSLNGILATLPRPDRLVVRLHYELDMSVASVAETLELTEGAVKVRLHRARTKLRSRLEPRW